jgi:5-hydroxyisourate hydrolase-like protein (transthyretin family)
MSTKTTFKRVALVAVASLGFGMLSVAPSSATAGDAATNASIASITVTNPTTPSVGATAAFTIAVTNATTIAAATADTYAIRAKITSAPAGGLSAFTGAFVAVTGWTNGAGAVGNSGPNLLSATWATGNRTAATVSIGTLTFTPAVAGTYAVNFYHDANLDGIQQDNEVYQTASISVGATAASAELANSADTTAGNNTTGGLKVGAVGIETVQVSGRTGIQVGFAPQYRITRNAGTITANDEADTTGRVATISYSVANPAGTAVTVVSAQGGATASTSQAIAALATPLLTSATADIARTQAISPTTGWPQKGSQVFFSAATAGTYTITAFHDANRDTLVSVGEATTTSTVVITADALPSITMTTFGQSLPADAAAGGNKGHLVRISLKNGTTPASLGLSEVLTVTGPSGTIIDDRSARDANFKLAMGDAGDSTSVALTQANFDAAGNAYITVGNNTAGGGTYALTATIAGGTGAGATGSGSFTVLSATLFPSTVFPDVAVSYTNLTGVAGTGRAADAAAASYALTVQTGVATTVAIGGKPGSGITAKGYAATLTDNFGLLTGLNAASYNLYRTVGTTATDADSVVSWSVAVPAMASTTLADAITLAIPVLDTAGGASTELATFNISQAAAVATTSFSNPAFTAASYTFRAAVASSNKMTVEVVDQFGNPLPNISVNALVAGRNSTTVIPTMLTNANGEVTYTLVDASTSTVLLSDTVTFTPAAGATSTVTINYATYLPASKITMVTPDSANATATGIAGTITSDINAGSTGASATTATVAITVTDANGATLPAGVPVTFSVAGANSAILSTAVTTVTDAAGKASTSVYAWKNVNAVVTATVGTITATGTVYFKQADCTAGSACAEARTITAKAAGNVVTANVTDRFGNGIKGVNVVASRKGTGTFNGTSSLTGVTDAAGSVDFVLTNGTADVTVAFETATFGQSAATKGFVNAGVTAIVASVAGTIATAETGVGASFDAAGINSATVVAVSDTATIDQAAAATDAAAEATDAANAATDAANAAAEAADAATAAAQDAADAVAALATSVSEMVSALKKQITSLTNLVIKIQKKVRA